MSKYEEDNTGKSFFKIRPNLKKVFIILCVCVAAGIITGTFIIINNDKNDDINRESTSEKEKQLNQLREEARRLEEKAKQLPKSPEEAIKKNEEKINENIERENNALTDKNFSLYMDNVSIYESINKKRELKETAKKALEVFNASKDETFKKDYAQVKEYLEGILNEE